MSEQYEYLVRGALLQCSCGSCQRRLNLPLCHGVYIGKNPVMNSGDYIPEVNVMSFGTCSKTGSKCMPGFAGYAPWLNVNRRLIVGDEDKYALTTNSYLECVTGGRITVVSSGQEYKMTENDYLNSDSYYESKGYSSMMKSSYGLSSEESKLYLKAYKLLSNEARQKKLKDKKKIYFIYSKLASLCDNYDGGEGLRWKITANIPSTEKTKLYLKKIGMSDKEVKDLHKSVNFQHANSTKKDLAHEWIVYAIFSADTLSHNFLDGSIGSLNALGSYKGDVFSTRMRIDDMNSDLDSTNTYNRMLSGKEPLDVVLDYNKKVENGKINRVDEFLKFYGNGSAKEGLKYIKRDLLTVDIGSQYISSGYKSLIQDALFTNSIVNSGIILNGEEHFNNVLKLTNRNQLIDVLNGDGIKNRNEDSDNVKHYKNIKKTKDDFIKYLEDGMSR
ncbi:MAG: DUF4280 domain-containing protein [Peptoanaerobacter stomatis]|uniref:DUF4280 domain-containing protein n=1 Tax=Peptoanaerobacter stomatis TaxID=796937 RepID=UPI003F9FE9BD